MEYSFDIEEAEKYGVDEAIILKNIKFWIMKNIANNKNLHDKRTWTFNSAEAFSELFPFWSAKQIRRILKSLIEQGILTTGNYNQIGYDRTLWYALTDESILPNGQMEVTKKSNRKPRKVTPIPYNKPDNKPNKDKGKNFKIPTFKEVEEYSKTIQFNLDGKHFIDYYETRGWMLGKSKMKDWKAAVRTWKRNQKNNKSDNINDYYKAI